jgi:hypothetical protein
VWQATPQPQPRPRSPSRGGRRHITEFNDPGLGGRLPARGGRFLILRLTHTPGTPGQPQHEPEPAGVAFLLNSLREAGATEHADALASRAAATIALADPANAVRLLDSLQRARAREQADALLARDLAATTVPDDPAGVAFLLDSLRETCASKEAGALRARLLAAGLFHLEAPSPQFRFGREPNGTPATPWNRDDLT